MLIVWWRYDSDCAWSKESYRDSGLAEAEYWFEEKKADNNDAEIIFLDHDEGNGEMLELVVLNQHRRIREKD